MASAFSDVQVVEQEECALNQNDDDSPSSNSHILKPDIEKALDELERVIYLATEESVKQKNICPSNTTLETFHGSEMSTTGLNSSKESTEDSRACAEEEDDDVTEEKEMLNVTSSPHNLLPEIIDALDELLELAHKTSRCTCNDENSNVTAEECTINQANINDSYCSLEDNKAILENVETSDGEMNEDPAVPEKNEIEVSCQSDNSNNDHSSENSSETQPEELGINLSTRVSSFSESDINSLKLDCASESQVDTPRKSSISDDSFFDQISDGNSHCSMKEEARTVMQQIKTLLEKSVLDYSEPPELHGYNNKASENRPGSPNKSDLTNCFNEPFKPLTLEEKLEANHNFLIPTWNFDEDKCKDDFPTKTGAIISGNKLEVYLQDGNTTSTKVKASKTTYMIANSYPELHKYGHDWEFETREGVCRETSFIKCRSDIDVETKNHLYDIQLRSKVSPRKLKAAGKAVGILDLPTEILALIFRRHFSFLEIASLGRACQRFHQVAGIVVRSGLLSLNNVIAERKQTLSVLLNLSQTIEQRDMSRTQYSKLKLFREYNVVEILESEYKMLRATTWKYIHEQTTCYTGPYIIDEFHRTLRLINTDHCIDPNHKPLVEFTTADMLCSFCSEFMCTFDIHHLTSSTGKSVEFGVLVFNLMDSFVNADRYLVVTHSPTSCHIHAQFLLSNCVLPAFPERKGEELSSEVLRVWCKDFRAAIQAHNRSSIQNREKEMNISQVMQGQLSPMALTFSVFQLEPWKRHQKTKFRNPATGEENFRHIVETRVLDTWRGCSSMITRVKIELECVPGAAPFAVQELLSPPPDVEEVYSGRGWYDISMTVDLLREHCL